MCGIAGIFNYASNEPVDAGIMEKMTRALTHRGPDAEGFYYDDKKGIGLGHRRLTIIDLQTGQQPMSNEDKTVWVTYNGELYNYREIKEQLKQKGHKFKTGSDTEVLIHAYMEYGKDFFKYLNGIFAFGLWDLKAMKMLIARDHLGVKPLYFFDSGKSLVFASEIKSLLLYPEYRKDVDIEAVDLHVTFRHTPAPRTLFKNIFKLPAGSYLATGAAGRNKIEYYWADSGQIDYSKNGAEQLNELSASVEKAVVRQMVSDVPISLSLSGGVDSNLLLAILSKHSEKSVNCFTIGFADNEKYDELAAAKESADYFNGHLETKILNSQAYQDMFNKYMWDLEEPVGNESALAYYFVARLAYENGIKVLLNGQGADELFGGYHRYLGERYRYFMSIVPHFLTKPLSRVVGNERLKRSFYSLNVKDELDRFFLVYSVFLPEEKIGLYNGDFMSRVDIDGGKGYLRPFFDRLTANHTPLDKMLYIDLRFSLPDNLLLAEDKMAMATSVEARVPFLDIGYVKIAETIPAEQKIKHFQFKYIHKKVAARWLPRRILKRKKIGFTNPMSDWLTNELERYFLGLINDRHSLTRRFFNIDFVNNMFNMHKSGKRDFKRNLFLMLSMEQWHRTFFS